MKCNPIPEREDWFITDRKPTICPRCKQKEVRKAVLGMPLEEDYFRDDIFVIGCIPDFPINRTWGCRNCDAAFFKDTPRNKAALGGLVPWQWPNRTEGFEIRGFNIFLSVQLLKSSYTHTYKK